jgi:hypothetical protein
MAAPGPELEMTKGRGIRVPAWAAAGVATAWAPGMARRAPPRRRTCTGRVESRGAKDSRGPSGR